MIELRAAIEATSIGGTALGDDVGVLLEAAMAAVDPLRWIAREVATAGAGLRIGAHELVPDPGGVLRIVGIGKAAPAIVAALVDVAGDRVAEALAIGKHEVDPALARPRLTYLRGAHPLPTVDSVAAGSAALALAGRTGVHDRLLAVITGGASSLACVPAADVDLAELRRRSDALARSGTPIAELNAARGRIDRLKHGGLARAARGRALALVLDDIPGGDPFTVGSGPLHAPGVPHVVIADNDAAVRAALAAAGARGLQVHRAPALVGEARELGRALAIAARDLPRPFAVVGGGECTVTRTGDGRGGRTMELALGAAPELADRDGLVFVAFATDGDDGSSGAAGAIVDGSTLARARALGCDLDAAIATSDTATALARLGDLLVTGASRTNVCDLVAIVAR